MLFFFLDIAKNQPNPIGAIWTLTAIAQRFYLKHTIRQFSKLIIFGLLCFPLVHRAINCVFGYGKNSAQSPKDTKGKRMFALFNFNKKQFKYFKFQRNTNKYTGFGSKAFVFLVKGAQTNSKTFVITNCKNISFPSFL